MAAIPVVTHFVMSLNRVTTTIAVTASATIVSMVSSNRAALITFVLLGFLTGILGSTGQLMIIVVPSLLVIMLFLFLL